MSEPLDALLRVARGNPKTVTEDIHTVDSVREDGAVNLRVGTRSDAVVPGIAALSSYTGRQAGDKVTVRKGRGLWLVVGKAGAEHKGSSVTVTTGSDPPGGPGWVQAQTVYARGDEVYIQRDIAAQPDPPAPESVTLTPNDSGGWANGHRIAGYSPRQGHYTAYGPFSGAWFYGSAIADACSGRTVAGMHVRLVRSGDPHGYYSRQQPSIWTHGYTSSPGGALDLSQRHDPTRGLGLGEGYDYPLTAAQVSSMASGSQKGIGVYTGEYRSDYIIFTGSCGQLTITFSS